MARGSKRFSTRHTRTAASKRFRGRLFADCTGDGSVGFLAGADRRMGREGRDETGESLAPPTADQILLGASVFLAARTTEPATFPACPWALSIIAEAFDVSPPKYPARFGRHPVRGGWNWESGFHTDTIAEAERIRDHNFRAIYGAWDFLKNRSPDKDKYAKAKLEWVGFHARQAQSRGG